MFDQWTMSARHATKRDPTEKLREANESDTWRPPEPYAAERAVHAMLAARRVTSDARRGRP